MRRERPHVFAVSVYPTHPDVFASLLVVQESAPEGLTEMDATLEG